jgi:phosphoribosylamine---glycine ligase
MNILILGSGGREHALAWRLAQDKSSHGIFVWPGNDGMKGEKIRTVSEKFGPENFIALIKKEKINLVIPGAEKFLYQGVSDWCRELEIPCFGPTKDAAELERSKLFSKNLMKEAGIQTAPFTDITNNFNNDLSAAVASIKTFKKPVIKISGPSLGKGVFVCETIEEATDVLMKLKANPIPGMEDGILVEESVYGQEVSVFFACHGEEFSYLGSAQDHKRLLENDKGPNTGGMGAISPVSWVGDSFIKSIAEKFLKPTLAEMKKRNTPFKGVLFLGLMVNPEETNLLEYNVRFGDPETQVILPLIDADFSEFLFSFSKDSKVLPLKLKNETAIHVVKAAKGYPGLFGATVEKGQPIHFFQQTFNKSHVFFAGVKRNGDTLQTDGGRVLGITSWGSSKHEARITAYEALNTVRFEGEHYRKDIGKKL